MGCMGLGWAGHVPHTIEEHVEADAKGPDISNLSVVRLPLTHLRSHESWSTHGPNSGMPMIHHASTAKVTDFDTPIRGQEHVVWLQVTVHDVL